MTSCRPVMLIGPLSLRHKAYFSQGRDSQVVCIIANEISRSFRVGEWKKLTKWTVLKRKREKTCAKKIGRYKAEIISNDVFRIIIT